MKYIIFNKFSNEYFKANNKGLTKSIKKAFLYSEDEIMEFNNGIDISEYNKTNRTFKIIQAN
jgi:hypothetical protein